MSVIRDLNFWLGLVIGWLVLPYLMGLVKSRVPAKA